MREIKMFIAVKPENLPEKFWDRTLNKIQVDVLLKSYLELENKLSTMSNTELNNIEKDLTLDELVLMIRDPRYWRDKDAIFIGRVTKGFQRIYGDK